MSSLFMIWFAIKCFLQLKIFQCSLYALSVWLKSGLKSQYLKPESCSPGRRAREQVGDGIR